MRCLLVALFMLSLSAKAEYRAYRLILMNIETGDEKTIVSTFDHIQYKGYYYLGPSWDIVYDTSWMCWGNTNYHKPICPPPDTSEETAGPRTNSENLASDPI